MSLKLSRKQAEFWTQANHRWNIKCGATRSGKTYLDYYVIPRRTRERSGQDGLVVILGNTRSSIQRNIVEPLQKIWTPALVSDIKSDNTIRIFGETAYCLGADKVSQVDVIRGSSIKYCYGDELVTWHPEMLEMLKSRLDKPYSIFDGTCNPDAPGHWAKKFIDSDADIYYQQYTIFDNPFLAKTTRDELLKEHKGIYYQRNILGLWVRAEGAIYREFSDHEDEFYITAEEVPRGLGYICVGQDFGGNRSKHTFCATAISRDGRHLYVLKSDEHDAKGTSVSFILKKLDEFCESIERRYGRVDFVFADSAEQAIINSEIQSTRWNVRNSVKREIKDRIRATDLMLSGRRIHIVKSENESLINALRAAVWDEKAPTDTRLDKPGETNVCPLDAFEYSWEMWLNQLTSYR